MASAYFLYDDALSIADDILLRTENRYELDKKRYFAALTIQRSYRGYAIRNSVKKWHRAANIIQKAFRGWSLRWKLPEIAAQAFEIKSKIYYNKMATKIQAYFRGYQVRKDYNVKYIFEEKATERETNDLILNFFKDIKDFKQQQSLDDMFTKMNPNLDEYERKVTKANRKIDTIINCLFQKHHLLRTKHIKGVLSNNKSDDLSATEKLLKYMADKDYMNNIHQTFDTAKKCENKHIFTLNKLKHIEDLLRDKELREPKSLKNQIRGQVEDIHTLPFILDSKVERKPYERKLFANEKYSNLKLPVFRDVSKTYLKEDTRKAPQNPYYLDFWTKKCCIHNIPK